MSSTTSRGGISFGTLLLLVLGIAVGVGGALLISNIAERKAEQRAAYVRVNEVTEDTTDPAVWGANWPKQYDAYQRTALATRTRFGGHGGSEALPAQNI